MLARWGDGFNEGDFGNRLPNDFFDAVPQGEVTDIALLAIADQTQTDFAGLIDLQQFHIPAVPFEVRPDGIKRSLDPVKKGVYWIHAGHIRRGWRGQAW